MQPDAKLDQVTKAIPSGIKRPGLEMVFGEARNFLNNRFIYLVISQRAHGLSIGVNMNPDQNCNFKCIYCEVSRTKTIKDHKLDVQIMSDELKQMLDMVHERKLQELPVYRNMPEELFDLKMITLSGDGEPTLCANFEEIVQELIHLRAQSKYPYFKMVLITNTTGIHLPSVQNGLRWFTGGDEVWAKLDAGNQEYMDRINRTHVPLERIMENIIMIGKQRPVVIQSLFPKIKELEPTREEIDAYVQRLLELKNAGTMISQVQIYSAHRPTALSQCEHLSLKVLSHIAQQVRSATGLKAEVF